MNTIHMERAYKWLNRPDGGKSFLSASIQQLINQLNEAIGMRDLTQAWNIIDQLQDISDSLARPFEIADLCLESARALYSMGFIHQALKNLGEAVRRYTGHRHNTAIALWMRGYILWHMPEELDDAVVSWQRSIENFKEQAKTHGVHPNDVRWYDARIEEMKQALADAIRNGGLPRENIFSAWDLKKADPASSVPKTAINKVGDIQANQFLVEGRPHHLYLMPGSPQFMDLSLLMNGLYVLQAWGNCMDRAGIEEGTYLLIQDDVPKDQDVVLVKTPNDPEGITFRRYVLSEATVILESESSDQTCRSWSYSPPTDKILGVVRGLFSPI